MKQALAVVAILVAAYAGSQVIPGLTDETERPTAPKPSALITPPAVVPSPPGSLPPLPINSIELQRIEDRIERQVRQERRGDLGSARPDDR